ncbi:hypothetical protein DPMN_085856 [Dreissena polymorpha]|uniref:Uncharacterized protein n=1 Tax=Dreissena polymorpha TaxID=45954 RepID=A0A9D3YEH6_DREPO|nr:hypothetical protein DPMN_085856 [Dreissena polymorpha]
MERDNEDRLSTVMEDFGVTEELINFRRYASDVYEILVTILARHKQDFPLNVHIVGSHSEGSTTLGLNSDIDFIIYFNSRKVYLALSECQTSLQSYLVIKSSCSSPQCVVLQYVFRYPDNSVLSNCIKSLLSTPRQSCPQYILDEEGRVLLSSEFLINNDLRRTRKHYSSACVIEQHGPAISQENYFDRVYAIHSQMLPLDCQVLFERPKSGHWPKEETTFKAKQCGVFFIYPGNIGHISSYDSSRRNINMDIRHQTIYASCQWRMSTSTIER